MKELTEGFYLKYNKLPCLLVVTFVVILCDIFHNIIRVEISTRWFLYYRFVQVTNVTIFY